MTQQTRADGDNVVTVNITPGYGQVRHPMAPTPHCAPVPAASPSNGPMVGLIAVTLAIVFAVVGLKHLGIALGLADHVHSSIGLGPSWHEAGRDGPFHMVCAALSFGCSLFSFGKIRS